MGRHHRLACGAKIRHSKGLLLKYVQSMDWDNIRFFLAVARAGTLSQAAIELGVTHVTVARRIDKLEALLDEQLFHRLHSGYQLTPVGEDLLPEAATIENAFLGFKQQLLSQSDSVSGELRLSVPEPCAIDLSPALAGFLWAYPDMRLEISSTMDKLDLNQLQAEVVIRVTDTPPEMLVGRELTRLSFAPYATDEYIAAKGRDLQQADWLLWQNADIDLERYLQHRDLVKNIHVLLRCDTNTQMFNALKSGMGVGIVTTHTADLHPQLKMLSDQVWGHRGLWILTHRNLRYSKRIKAFMQYMSDYDY